MNSIDMVTFTDPKSPVSEIYRTLRTNIKFTSFQKDVRTIVITSAGPKEGKTTVTANLGITMAQSGSRVLIIDGDLRNPSMHKKFMLPNRLGLTNILVDNGPCKDYIHETDVKNLDLILCGPKPPNPAELLGSKPMKDLLENLKKQYDYILIDTPPAIALTDAALLSSVSDGTLLVIASGKTAIEDALRTKEVLEGVGAKILGVIHNKVKGGKPMEYYKYYRYDSDETGDKKAKKQGLMG